MKILGCFICLMLLLSFSSNAQIIDIKEKIKNKSIDRADQRTDEGIDKGLDKAEDGIKSIFTKGNKDEADEAGEVSDEQVSDENKNEKAVNTKSPEKQEKPKLESCTKYDFIPGDKVLLFEDFSKDAVGDFPALWSTNGSGEVRTLNNYPGNWLYMNSQDNVYTLMKDLSFPDNFIVEFDVVPTPAEEGSDRSGCYLSLYHGEGEFLDDGIYPGDEGVNVALTESNWSIVGYGLNQNGEQQMLDGQTELAPVEINKSNHVIIWVQKRRLRIYHKGQKALDLPTVLFPQAKYNRLRFSLWGNEGFSYVTNIRITSAAPDMRSKLLTDGKIVSYGIYFDVDKYMVKPESYGTLKEIAKVLTENPDVKIKIVGHTDSDGADAANLDLSKKRAASVKNELVKTFAVNVSRIETDGKGESQPIASNDSPSNKALNRRVEFIKQ